MGVDPRTYARRSQEKHLKRSESKQVELIEGALSEATRVFRDEGLAREWLVSSIISLDNRRPIDHLGSIGGYERVRNTLVKIEYRMYSGPPGQTGGMCLAFGSLWFLSWVGSRGAYGISRPLCSIAVA